MNKTTLDILGTKPNRKAFKAQHCEYKCSRIKHCEFAYPDVLRIYPAYDDIVLEDIPKLAQQASATIVESKVEVQLKEQTEAFFNAFLYNQHTFSSLCQFPLGERVCSS